MINIKSGTAKLMKEEFQIEEKVTQLLFEKGLIQEHDARKVLIKTEYERKVEPCGRQLLKEHIADRYCVSVATVEKIIAVKPL